MNRFLGLILFLGCLSACEITTTSSPGEVLLKEQSPQHGPWLRVHPPLSHEHRVDCGHVKWDGSWYRYTDSPMHIHGTPACGHKYIGGYWHVVGRAP